MALVVRAAIVTHQEPVSVTRVTWVNRYKFNDRQFLTIDSAAVLFGMLEALEETAQTLAINDTTTNKPSS